MNILSMSDRRNDWDNPKLKYVGRSKYALVLGNPWSHTNVRQAMFYTSTPQAALDNYRHWLLQKLVPHYIQYKTFVGLKEWEKIYLSRVVLLSQEIEAGIYTSLGCWCVNILDYTPVIDGYEKCHAEILYKACLQLIKKEEGAIKL